LIDEHFGVGISDAAEMGQIRRLPNQDWILERQR